MIRPFPLLVLLLSTAMATAPAASQPSGAADAQGAKSAPSLQTRVTDKAQQMQRRNDQWQQQQLSQQRYTKATTAELKTTLAARQAQLTALKADLVALQAQKSELEQQKQAAQADLSLVQTSYQQMLSAMTQRWQRSLTSYLAPQRAQWLQQQLAQPHFPAIAELEQLIQFALADMRYTGQINHAQAPVLQDNGKPAATALTILGSAMAIGDQAQQLGLVDGHDNRFIGVSDDLASAQQQWLSGTSPTLMLDVSQGALLPLLAEPQSLLQTLRQGGELLWPLLAVAAAGLITLVVCAVRLFYWQPLGANVDTPPPQQTISGRQPAAAVLRQAASHQDLQGVDYALKQGMLKQVGRFERGLALVALLAALAPMLGLLGTVTGMIETFQTLTQFGNSEPKLLSGGISKALITTQVGLVIAIPLLLLLHPLKRRAQRLTLDMEQHGAWLLAQRAETAASGGSSTLTAATGTPS
ncbi:MotA/TolQ/ExbB proton channel family protein [Ferrimonas kyonanensis]|uniref:MotA/TolQ/ExbB proton channel family protein n=1 Tax=Ferrimonas kyonanensis TaxID=364763 RepID=UPI00041B0F41|nr:MotA/TolQ/ExbB proton channel family protein [Ferrimonas kyonanensis]